MIGIIIGVIAGVLFASLVVSFVVRGINKRPPRILPPEERRSPEDLRLKLGADAKPQEGSATALLEPAEDRKSVV